MRCAALYAATQETVEWFYAFDVHCNAFLPVYLALYGLQYVLLPLLLHSGFVAAALSSALYALAFSAYHYLTFLGYSGATPPLSSRPCNGGAPPAHSRQ